VTQLLRLWRPATTLMLAALAVLLAVALVPLSLAARQNPLDTGGVNVVIAVSFAAVGVVVAWHRPRNPIGWLMLILAAGFVLYIDAGLYNVLNYRLGHRYPLAPVVLLLYHAGSEPDFALVPLAIFLFPDGRLPTSPRWRRVVAGFLALAVIDVIVQAQMVVYALGHHRTQVEASGQLVLSNGRGAYGAFGGLMALLFFAFWIVAVGYQVMTWRRAAGERRQQLSWLMAGGAAALISFLAAIAADLLPRDVRGAVGTVLVIGIAALPAGMGVAILKYRLYEINRIISRTLAYAVVTGLLVGLYAGLVLLATRVLSVSSPVAVAGSTLAAAALFNPVRRRVQLRVDRRFNRAKYHADQIVAAFATRLTGTVDLDSVRTDLVGVVHEALQPAYVSLWTNDRRENLR
jgi:hypothetical protein